MTFRVQGLKSGSFKLTGQLRSSCTAPHLGLRQQVLDEQLVLFRRGRVVLGGGGRRRHHLGVTRTSRPVCESQL
jgi:hypothetical protein